MELLCTVAIKPYTMAILILITTLICMGITLSDAECPSTVLEMGVPLADQNTIVNKHNELRDLISQDKVPGQPRGVNLKILKWDPALAAEAQSIANTCNFKHVSVSDERWWWVGQNLFSWWGSAISLGSVWDVAVQVWFNEHKNFIYPNASTGVTGHYTQVVWADTEYVGCGYTSWIPDRGHKKLYVCNYGPGGNIRGVAPYRTA